MAHGTLFYGREHREDLYSMAAGEGRSWCRGTARYSRSVAAAGGGEATTTQIHRQHRTTFYSPGEAQEEESVTC